MAGYWWQCGACGEKADFPTVCNSKSICAFIRDVLLAADFDQEPLLRECQSCQRRALRITFEFPRVDREVVRVLHVVGLPQQQETPYLPMIWETCPVSDPEARWFHFNYMNQRNPWGLNKAAVFESHDLQAIFDFFTQKTGHSPLLQR
jgi:hypothetical protein